MAKTAIAGIFDGFNASFAITHVADKTSYDKHRTVFWFGPKRPGKNCHCAGHNLSLVGPCLKSPNHPMARSVAIPVFNSHDT